jgi:hypothetical protein
MRLRINCHGVRSPWQLINMGRALAQFAKPIPLVQFYEYGATSSNAYKDGD